MPQWNQGIEYMCQWAIDDIPTPLKTKFGDVISVPYGLDLNDSVLYAIEKHSMPEMKLRIEQAIRTFEREITEFGQPRVLTIPLHPHLSSSVGHRINFLTDIVEGLHARSDTVFMNGSQITDWYLSQRKTASPLLATAHKNQKCAPRFAVSFAKTRTPP
jgi:hypothetical protein